MQTLRLPRRRHFSDPARRDRCPESREQARDKYPEVAVDPHPTSTSHRNSDATKTFTVEHDPDQRVHGEMDSEAAVRPSPAAATSAA
jgi:hypothetical protein